MKPSAIASRLRMDVRHFGVLRTAYQLLMKGIQRVVDFRIMRVSRKQAINPEYLEGDDDFEWRFLDESRLLPAAGDPNCPLDESLAQTAFDRGDQCYGAMDGDVLVCCSWYSTQPTDDMGLTAAAPPGYVYSYAAFTDARYRGRRLFAIRGNRALRALQDQGFRGFYFTTDSHNLRALRAAPRLGAEPIGTIVALRIGKLAWIYTSRGCRRHGFSLSRPITASELAPTA